jgi:hypothetical protein
MDGEVLNAHLSISGLRTEAVNMEGREALLSLVRNASDPEDEYNFRCPLV